MKQKTTIIILTCILTASLILAIGAVSFAWYTARISEDKEVEIVADGFLVVGFDEEPLVVDDKLAPAIAMKNAVRDNMFMDVTRVYDKDDTPLSYIEKVAESYTHTDTISFYEDPNDTTSSSYNFTLTAQAFVKEGSEDQITKINTTREISFDIKADINYTDESLTDVEDLAITPEVKFNVLGSATITLEIKMWLSLPDELCDPALISNKLYFEFGIAVEPVTATEETT